MKVKPAGDVHSLAVASWEKTASKDLSLVQHVHLFEIALRTVQNRACRTLSSVTLLVILDRMLSQGLEEYPVLSGVTLESHSLKFKNCDQLSSAELGALIKALRFFLVELLRVFGRLTADILTIPLHNELLKVSWTDLERE